ncbi:MAG TPA: SMI1/KNR4 family protein, partial [Chthoniobacteraceae bacterium]|nr:SMI1/KNR4 family protein [Chthoniobacteraceae bacterium]
MSDDSRYCWFEAEIEAVKTRKFFLIPRDGIEEELIVFEKQYGELPFDYRTFLRVYGGASLFRDPEWGFFPIRLFRVPKIAYAGRKGEGTFADIGYWNDRLVYIHINDACRTFSPEILEHLPSGGIRTVAPNFVKWLRTRYEKERKRFKKKGWLEILSGPPALTDQEREALE